MTLGELCERKLIFALCVLYVFEQGGSFAERPFSRQEL